MDESTPLTPAEHRGLTVAAAERELSAQEGEEPVTLPTWDDCRGAAGYARGLVDGDWSMRYTDLMDAIKRAETWV